MMLIRIREKLFANPSYRLPILICLIVLVLVIMQSFIPNITNIRVQIAPRSNTANDSNRTAVSQRAAIEDINKHTVNLNNSTFIHDNQTLETTVRCVGSLYNQSCLFMNLYYVDSAFVMLTIKGRDLPECAVRTDAFNFWPMTPRKREFDSYSELEKFVRTLVDPKRIPDVTLYFGQPWHFNVGHALFDGLYPAYVALIRFAPRHLHPFRILAGVSDCNDCWPEDVYSRFAGLGIIKQLVLNKVCQGRWFMFDEIVMGSGTLCQRCTQPHLQLAGGVELDASRLFRDRMYQQHGFIRPIVRRQSSSEHRTSHDLLRAYVIDNKRFTPSDRQHIDDAINEINNYTNAHINKTTQNSTTLEWPLINVTYIYYHQIQAQNMSSIQVNATLTDSRSPTYELFDNNFIAQLRIVRQMDIHITGPGTGQMYQTFLSDGSVSINIGGIRPWASENTPRAYTSFLEQHMTSGAPYIKGLYYPINERQKGIHKDEVVKLIRQAGQLILQGFSLPVNPRENLAPDGQLFVEMCERDKDFCASVTTRSAQVKFICLELWVEDFVHEYYQWKEGGFVDNGHNQSCPFNRPLLRELRNKYGIKRNQDNSSKSLRK